MSGDDSCEYKWQPSASACEECLAMEGTYAEEPGPPHDNCTCSVSSASSDDDEVSADVDASLKVDPIPGSDECQVTINILLQVECPDGSSFEENFEHSERMRGAEDSLNEWAEEMAAAWIDVLLGEMGEHCATKQCVQRG